MFTRSRHSVVPTEAGNTFYPYVLRLLSLQREALQALQPDAPDFWLHFVCGDVHDPIQQALLHCYTERPDTRIELLPPVSHDDFSSVSRLTPRHLYLVRRGWLRDEGIRFFELGRARYSILLSPVDSLAQKSAISFSELSDRLLLTNSLERKNGPFMLVMERLMQSAGPDRYIVCRSEVEALARLLSDQGRSVYILPFFVQVAGENRFIRRSLVTEASADPIGLAFIGQLTMPMSRFIQAAAGCYRDIPSPVLEKASAVAQRAAGISVSR